MKANPTIGSYIDDEERELIEALEAPGAKFKSHLTPTRKKQIEAIARATLSGEREKITLRISKNDLSRIKSKAMQEGMPYQTLISSILHKAVS
jgi:predicted DNA binding CopG/RHH family protein